MRACRGNREDSVSKVVGQRGDRGVVQDLTAAKASMQKGLVMPFNDYFKNTQPAPIGGAKSTGLDFSFGERLIEIFGIGDFNKSLIHII